MAGARDAVPVPGEDVTPGARSPSADPVEMVHLAGGTFRMGSDRHYPEEAPAHLVTVDPFRIDVFPVTNRRFAAFVVATGHRTTAEIAPRAEDYPGALPHMLRAGSLTFRPPRGPVPLGNAHAWWAWTFGACWHAPCGPGSSITGLEDHPVVHVSHSDALAYARWAGKDLPTEAEWEFAARGGLDGADYAWGDEMTPGGRHMANTWQGRFPFENLLEDGHALTSPVGFYPANGYGLHDMIGNTWEWTQDWYVARHAAEAAKACCIPRNPRGPRAEDSIDPRDAARIPRKVLKGGSHLCAPNYCRRYRPAARYPEPVDTSTSHVGFRCVLRSGTQGG